MHQRRRRSGIILGLLSIGLFSGAALTTGPAQAVSGLGPYYAEPAWDRKIGVVNRFLVLTNWNSDAVLDKETGLVWEQAPQMAATSWSNARVVCTGKAIGNRKGWRLPSVHELASLIDPNVTPGPVLPVGHPFTDVQLAGYWSAATLAGDPTDAWNVDFGNGAVLFTDKAGSRQVWCVRGGTQADAY